MENQSNSRTTKSDIGGTVYVVSVISPPCLLKMSRNATTVPEGLPCLTQPRYLARDTLGIIVMAYSA
jgi:hypothetical protein